MSRPRRVARMPGPRKCHPHCMPGRHVLTSEDRAKGGRTGAGFEAMKMALLERSPDKVCGYHGCHISGCFLKHKYPLEYAARKLKHKVDKFEPRGPEDAAKLNELKQGVAALVDKARTATSRAK